MHRIMCHICARQVIDCFLPIHNECMNEHRREPSTHKVSTTNGGGSKPWHRKRSKGRNFLVVDNDRDSDGDDTEEEDGDGGDRDSAEEEGSEEEEGEEEDGK